MPQETSLPLRHIVDADGRVLRLEVDAFVFSASAPAILSEKVAAIMDTGAMRSTVPPIVIDYLLRHIPRQSLMELSAIPLTLADGTERSSPRYALDFLLIAPARPPRFARDLPIAAPTRPSAANSRSDYRPRPDARTRDRGTPSGSTRASPSFWAWTFFTDGKSSLTGPPERSR